MTNKVILIGRVGKEPEAKNIPNGTAVTALTLATSEQRKDRTSGEKKEATEWHNVVLWRGLAEIAAKYVHKGDLLYIEGKLRTRSWEKDGMTRYTTEIVADEMKMLGSKQPQRNTTPAPMESSGHPTTENSTDDLPF
jgi:single-strand DNA-binding protein